MQCQPAGSPQSADYDPVGYLYAIEMPQAQPALQLEVYDAGLNTSLSPPDSALATETQTVTTTFEVFGADNTPLDTSDNPLLSTTTVTHRPTSSTGTSWMPLHTWVNPAAGTYYLRVKTSAAQTTESRASNGFGLRAYTGALFATCTSIVGRPPATRRPARRSTASAPCRSTPTWVGSSGSTATFYLAQVATRCTPARPCRSPSSTRARAPRDRGARPQRQPGDVQLVDPCNPPTPPSGSCSGSAVTSLNVSGTGTQPYTGLQGNSKYNDRKMTLDISLPANYTTIYGSKIWWRSATRSAPPPRTALRGR